MADFKICEEYLTLHFIHGSTKRAGIFCEFYPTLQEAQLDSLKLFSMATDRYPSMYAWSKSKTPRTH